ncbi:hypothetical protein LTR95_007899 [Oleoguttula sp. CCFEE 5521]
MASNARKLIPSDPEKVMVIRSVTPDIKTFSTPFLRFGRIAIGGRGTAVRLQSGNTAVFSPVALTPTVKEEMHALGPAKYLVALDAEHHIFLEEWSKAYPDARVVGPETLPGLRDKQGHGKIAQDKWVLLKAKDADAKTLSVDAEFDAEFDLEYAHGHGNKEVVVNHRKSGTLIEADLLFNLPATEQMSKSGLSPTGGLLTKLMVWLNNSNGEALSQRRFLWYGAAQDKKSFNPAMARIASWNFDRIIPCHGDVIETGGKRIFEKVMEWHIQAARKST